VKANFGPWASELPEAERLAHWRALRAAAMLLVGGSHPLVATLCAAEIDAEAAHRAFDELMQLPPWPD
jgi:hypothetical protein